MRLSVYTVSLTAALLIPGAAAFADPPWQRGHEYEVRSYAGAPPPWAPAHGWRRKHAQYYEHEVGM
jgi:hypothetical protein